MATQCERALVRAFWSAFGLEVVTEVSAHSMPDRPTVLPSVGSVRVWEKTSRSPVLAIWGPTLSRMLCTVTAPNCSVTGAPSSAPSAARESPAPAASSVPSASAVTAAPPITRAAATRRKCPMLPPMFGRIMAGPNEPTRVGSPEERSHGRSCG